MSTKKKEHEPGNSADQKTPGPVGEIKAEPLGSDSKKPNNLGVTNKSKPVETGGSGAGPVRSHNYLGVSNK